MVSSTLESRQDKQMETKTGKPCIMIVDDNVELLEELENLLRLGNYDVIALNDGTQVLEKALMKMPDLILLDLKMSPKSGFQIADEAKNSSFLRNIPIIAMTGFFTEKQHFLMMKLCGIRTSILKPFRPLNLFTKIEFALGNRSEEFDITDGT